MQDVPTLFQDKSSRQYSIITI